jgi:hypothetical protein
MALSFQKCQYHSQDQAQAEEEIPPEDRGIKL